MTSLSRSEIPSAAWAKRRGKKIYHREVARNASRLPEAVRELLPRLRDREFTRILIVTLPEPTPVHEAADLQRDLRRAHIEPWAWVINQSLVLSRTTDPVLAARGQGEVPYINEVVSGLARRTALVPWLKDEPVGPARLRQLFAPADLDPGSYEYVS